MNCIFCKIISGEQQAELVWRDEDVVAFKDISPKAPIHILIVPTKHITSIKELSGADRNTVASLIFAARDIAKEKELAGYKLVFNVGREGGQVIDHLHLHLIGGWKSNKERKKSSPEE